MSTDVRIGQLRLWGDPAHNFGRFGCCLYLIIKVESADLTFGRPCWHVMWLVSGRHSVYTEETICQDDIIGEASHE